MDNGESTLEPALEPAVEIVEEPPVLMFTAPNPGPKTLTGTHTYVVGREETYVIDPGPLIPLYQENLAKRLSAYEHQVRAILLTHMHPDHAPGGSLLGQLVSAPVWAPSAQEEVEGAQVEGRLTEGDHFAVGDDVLRVVRTPGHTPDHVSFFLEAAGVLFSGDHILGEGTTLVAPPEGHMADYMASLTKLRELGARVIAPGHGSLVNDPQGKIEEYLRHRREREEQVMNALERGPATIDEIVRRVYTDVDPSLHELAAGSVAGQVEKLEVEGKLIRSGEVYRRA